jgi:hypothetical protein
MIAMYVDDIPAACNNTAWLISFKARIGARIKIKDLGALSQLFGMHITRDMYARTFFLDESKYLRDIVDMRGMTGCKPSPLPMDLGFVSGLARMDSPLLTSVAKDILLGSLQYAPVRTRLDVSIALSILGSAHAQPTEVHLETLKNIVRYLKGTIQLRLTLGGNRS